MDKLLVFLWVPIVHLSLFCMRDFMLSLSEKSQANVVEAGCLDDLLNIDSPCFGQVVGWICPAGFLLGWVGLSCAGALFWAWACPLSVA